VPSTHISTAVHKFVCCIHCCLPGVGGTTGDMAIAPQPPFVLGGGRRRIPSQEGIVNS